MAATQNLASSHHQGTELQYLPYQLQSRSYIQYQPSQVSQPLNQHISSSAVAAAAAQRNNTQFGRSDPFIHVSSIVVPGIQGNYIDIMIYNFMSLKTLNLWLHTDTL